jgi:putative ABC transport system permease protein
MPTFREWMQRLLGLMRRGRRDRDLEEELRSHVQLAEEDAVRRRMPPQDAARTARIHAGNTALAMDALRDRRGLPWADELMRDVRHGLRVLWRTPSFTAVAVLTLALGIGANAAVYQLLDAIRLRALPVAAPEQLTVVQLADTTRLMGRRATGYPALTNPLWEQFRDRQEIFAGVLAWANAEFRLDRSAGRRAVNGLLVSGEFFNVLGVNAHIGRLLTPADDQRGCEASAAVISHGFWQRQFGGDVAAVGKTLGVGGRSLEVVGVTTPAFFGVEVGRAFDVAVPICAQPSLGGEQGWLTDGTTWWLTVMGRMAPGQSLGEVNRTLEAFSPGLFESSLTPEYPRQFVNDYLRFTLRAEPGSNGVSRLRGLYADPLVILQLTTGVVLFIACTNLANLVLARASAREREFAVRLAVGGSWRRLVRQLMVENALLSMAGAIVGLACATVLSRFLVSQLGRDLSLQLPLDLRLISVMLGMAFITCLTFGLLPAWRASRVSATDAMKANVRTVSGNREGTALRRVLVVAQVACSLLLLFGGLLFTTSLRNLLAVDTGFESRDVAAARVDFSTLSVPPASRPVLTAAVLDGIRQTPGVSAAAEVRHVPLGGTGSGAFVSPVADATQKSLVRLNAMSPGYLETMGLELLAGRDFDRRDSSGAPKVAIVNRTLARRLGLGDNPVGQMFRGQTGPSTLSASDVFEVIGLVPDSKMFLLREDPQPIVFVPMAQITDPRRFTDVMVRSTVPPAELSLRLAQAMAAINPAIDVDVRPFDDTIRDVLVRDRLMATLSSVFGVLAAVIAAVGLYGVMSYLVLRRTNEIGVRMTLGAQRHDILKMILGEAGTLLAIGLAVGAVTSFAAAGSARALLFGLEPHDIPTLALACLLLGGTATAASYLPARRAATIPPLIALREE